MNICFFCGGFAANGGIGRVTAILSGELAHRDYNVFLCSFYEVECDSYYPVDDKCFKEELFPNPITMQKALLKGHAIKKLIEYIKKNQIDVIVACGALYYPLVTVAARRSGIKLICWEHINPKIKSDYKFQDQCRAFGAKRSDVNIQLTKSALRMFDERFPQKRNVQIYNPIDSALLSSEPVYKSDSKRIISVGRLCYQKNFERLIDIANIILTENPEWNWDIYGEGVLRNSLQNKIDTLGLNGRVNLCGQVGDIYDRYNDYSMIVMTSRYEGFPMVLLEGAARGLPMISFDFETGPNEIIENYVNGFLCDQSSNNQIVEAITKTIGDESLRCKLSSGSRLTAEKFSLERITGYWDELLKNI